MIAGQQHARIEVATGHGERDGRWFSEADHAARLEDAAEAIDLQRIDDQPLCVAARPQRCPHHSIFVSDQLRGRGDPVIARRRLDRRLAVAADQHAEVLLGQRQLCPSHHGIHARCVDDIGNCALGGQRLG